jgi:hypothetical protein
MPFRRTFACVVVVSVAAVFLAWRVGAAKTAVHLAPPPASTAGSGPLIQSRHLVYEGAFRLPDGPIGGSSFAYGGTALAFNPAHHSLFLVGHDWQQQVAEVSVPEIRTAAAVRRLDTASVLQPFADPTHGRREAVGSSTVKIGGVLPYQGQLYVTAYVYYDAMASQQSSHFVTALDLAAPGEARGPYRVGDVGAGFVAGYLGTVPAAWRDALGGPVLTGQCCLPIISRTSFGPALFAIEPARLGGATPLPAAPLLYYPQAHPLAAGDTTSTLFNLATEIRGVVFHEGTRSVLFFGRQGLGTYCYGPGTADPKQAGQPADGNVDRWCFDPSSESKGTHAYPYRYYVWAYDANDLAAVKAGRLRPWEPRPYATWPLDLPFSSEGHAELNGAAYDPESGRIFVSQAYGDGERPLIHVLTVQLR